MDWYNDNYYAASTTRDPQGPTSGSGRVLRGGSFGSIGMLCRPAARNRCGPGLQWNYHGLRVVIVDTKAFAAAPATQPVSMTQ